MSRKKREPSRGSEALSRLLANKRVKDVAESLGVGSDQVSRWANGVSKPDTANRRTLCDWGGIGIFEWDDPPSREQGNPAA